MNNEYPIYKVILGLSDGIKKMSLVNQPAVDVDFVMLSKQDEVNYAVQDEEQHIVFGCALRADFPIYREDAKLGKYYMIFSKESIIEFYEKFMMDGRQNIIDLDHKDDATGVYMLQSFIKDSEKGIAPAGFEDVADGSWFCSYKITNEKLWEDVKMGKYKGFSIEAQHCLANMFNKQEEKDDLDELIDEILN